MTALLSINISIANAAPALSQMTTCTDWQSGHQRIAVVGLGCRSRNEFTAIWQEVPSAAPTASGHRVRTLSVCASDNDSAHAYWIIGSKCFASQSKHIFQRDFTAPYSPKILGVKALSNSSVSLSITLPPVDSSAPIAFYLVTTARGGASRQIFATTPGTLVVTSLATTANNTYTVSAVNVDDKSLTALATMSRPSISLSATSEVATPTGPIRGYTIRSTGGPVYSYVISPDPAANGLFFDPATGLLSGYAPVVTSNTDFVYTVTAINAAGRSSQNYTLSVHYRR